MRGKAIVIMSGGPDSSTVACYVKKEGYEVHGLAFDYGQIARKEVEHAKIIANRFQIPLKVIDLSSLKQIFKGATALCDEEIPMPASFEQRIIVPFRNAIFLSIAVSYANSIGASVVFYGAQGDDASFYPDCRKEFFETFQKSAQLGTGSSIRVEAPFHGKKKSEILRIGEKLDLPYELTWSCYLGGAKHCGRCESCLNRKKAFAEAGIIDPTSYES